MPTPTHLPCPPRDRSLAVLRAALIALVQAEVDRGRCDRALLLADQLVAERPDLPDRLLLRADVRAAAGDRRGAQPGAGSAP